jgi:hypothetical protein
MPVIYVTDGDFACLCGNNSHAQGAFPCDRAGDLLDPKPDEWPDDLFRCDRCGLIFNGHTGEVLPRPEPKPEPMARQCFTCSTITRDVISCSACTEPVCHDCIVRGRHCHNHVEW